MRGFPMAGCPRNRPGNPHANLTRRPVWAETRSVHPGSGGSLCRPVRWPDPFRDRWRASRFAARWSQCRNSGVRGFCKTSRYPALWQAEMWPGQLQSTAMRCWRWAVCNERLSLRLQEVRMLRLRPAPPLPLWNWLYSGCWAARRRDRPHFCLPLRRRQKQHPAEIRQPRVGLPPVEPDAQPVPPLCRHGLRGGCPPWLAPAERSQRRRLCSDWRLAAGVSNVPGFNRPRRPTGYSGR